MLSDILKSIKPMLIASYLTGVFNFTINEKSLSIKTQKWHKLTTIAVITIHIIAAHFYSNSDLMDKMFFTKTSKITTILVYLGHFLCVSSMVWIFIKRENFLKILIKLSEIDEKLNEFGVEIDYKQQSRDQLKGYFWFVLTFAIAWNSSIVYQIYYDLKIEISVFIFDMTSLINAVALISHFVILMSNISLRFELMTSCADHSILEVSKIHLKIAECVKIYNSIYGIPMMLIFGNLFIWSCISASLIVLIPKSDFITATGFIVCLIFTALLLMGITKAAEKLTKAKQEIIHILYTKMSVVPQSSESIFRFIIQVRHSKPGFSCNFFEFNWKLIFNFTTAFIMYFIIIIQFEESFGNGNYNNGTFVN